MSWSGQCGRIRDVPTLRLTQDAAADELLGQDPLALLLGMLFDQHMHQRSSGTLAVSVRRLPEWWAGVQTSRRDGADARVMWPEDHPDFPMPQRLHTEPEHSRGTVSCQVSDIDVVSQLAVQAGQHDTIQRSLAHLAPWQKPGRRHLNGDV